ncbi:MAG: iron-containing alcohol dehydrogenase family protein [Clostridia bacterium]|nr:iron-containing alcohol dehydrogenase family protein [Clostridia bacterium]NCC42636.1 iron-containing alcohol dehydrogenase family protein [Clostridia bacterium]
MMLTNYEMNLPSYSIGDDIYKSVPSLCAPYGKNVLIIGGARALDASRKLICQSLLDSPLTVLDTILFGDDCTYANVERLRSLPAYQEADMVFSVGGGKCIDTCKCLCIPDDKPIFTFPTIASNCAACTSVSIMYNEDGTFLKPHFYLHPPLHAFIHTGVISKAPSRYMWAGIGDTYAKYYEATISSRDEQLEHFTALGVSLSHMCLDPLVLYAPQAYKDNKIQKTSYELEQTVLAIVVTTGIVSIFLTRDFTPDYNSGLAHAIFYALTSYPVIEEKHLHGEVVGFGVLIALLCDGQQKEFEKIYELNKKINLPVRLEDIEITKKQFDEIISRIPEMSDVRHYPYAITREMLESALTHLDEYTRSHI